MNSMNTRSTTKVKAARAQARERGFTLIELSISMLVMAAVIVGILALFDSTNQLAKTQLNRVDLQQSLRVSQREMVRTIRLAGRGGLPVGSKVAKLPDNGWALKIANNVAGRQVLDGGTGPDVVDGTDILVVRGVISTPVYLVDHLDPASFTIDTVNMKGTVVVRKKMPLGNVEQDLDSLCDLLSGADKLPEALVLVSAFDDRVVGTVQIDYNASGGACPNADTVTLGFVYSGTPEADKYAKLSEGGPVPGVFPADLMERARVSSVGVLEEYRFYLRDGRQMDEGGGLGTTVRKLSRARVFPNTDAGYGPPGSDTAKDNLQIDIAENVIDFQVAMALDLNGDGLITDTGDGTDEWLGNSATDDPTTTAWTDALAEGGGEFVRFVRLTTLAKAAEGERSNLSKELVRLEDHVFSPTDPLNDLERKFPRVVLQSIAEMRNL